MFSIFIASITASRSPARTAWPGATATSTSRPGIGDSRKRDRSGGGLNGISALQLGGARRQHPHLDLRAAVGDAVAEADALDLGTERLAVGQAVRWRRRAARW